MEVVSILAQGLDIESGVPIYQTEYSDGTVQWEPRNAFIGTGPDGEEEINETFQQWENTHPNPLAQAQAQQSTQSSSSQAAKKVKQKPSSSSSSSNQQHHHRSAVTRSKVASKMRVSRAMVASSGNGC